jgi:hypothetical protein
MSWQPCPCDGCISGYGRAYGDPIKPVINTHLLTQADVAAAEKRGRLAALREALGFGYVAVIGDTPRVVVDADAIRRLLEKEGV